MCDILTCLSKTVVIRTRTIFIRHFRSISNDRKQWKYDKNKVTKKTSGPLDLSDARPPGNPIFRSDSRVLQICRSPIVGQLSVADEKKVHLVLDNLRPNHSESVSRNRMLMSIS